MALEDKKNKYYTAKLNSLRIPITLTGNFYNRLMLPALPTNYAMLMSDIDYPEKAKLNPNGSLFMKPTEEILKNKALDYGTKFFGGNINFKGIFNFSIDTNSTNESYISLLKNKFKNNSYIQSLFEGDLNPTSHGSGKNINQHTLDRQESKLATFNGNIIDAIDQYIETSIMVVDKLVRGVCGERSDIGKNLTTAIGKINLAAIGNLSDWIKKNDEFIKSITDRETYSETRKLKNAASVQKDIINILLFFTSKKDKIKGKPEAINKFVEELSKACDETVEEKDVNRIIKSYIQGVKSIDDLKRAFKDSKDIFVIESIKYNNNKKLFEDEEYISSREAEEKLGKDKPGINFDTLYLRTAKYISNLIKELISNDPTQWASYKKCEERMKALKEGATKEINAKIDLICRTANSGNVDIGDKFKMAISKHPIRAESLKNLWIRYSDDLDGRIESRLNSISGANGASSAYDTIREFLVNTYPNLLAMMLIMKDVLYLVKLVSEKYPSVSINEEETRNILEESDLHRIRAAIIAFEN